MKADSKQRPRTAIELRNEHVLVDFLNRLENGERPCDLVPPPFEHENDTQIRELKREIADKDRKIAELENRLNAGENSREEINQLRQIIKKQKEVRILAQSEISDL